ncbi:uncharacterized protein M421DRAFT_102043 [Didymella exigua CBS 183.55]|uniref:DNA repair protein Rad26 n=1 Tax=Didymella exigua CBS 183.55 TaxID=1150837 RepID=A0A6A5RHD3_9PLEO|nr:uncharacterized protein M421DRAFT_102043 [Didymella exigua CBS 183.55]KAF1926913.1 hypothetical protein M421DRAFT_102043 [Didymella exigua CBS 183.55]
MSADDDFDFSDHGLDDLPANAIAQFEAAAIRATQQPQTAPRSDYGLDDDDEVVNLDDEAPDAPDEAPDAFDKAPDAFDKAPDVYDEAPDEAPDAPDEGAAVDESRRVGHTSPVAPPRPSQADPVRLRSRIKKLEQDQARERRDADDLKARLQTKAGEADTLRRRHHAELRRHERHLADQQRLHGDELAKLRAEMEQLRRDKEHAATSNLFHQHDARDAAMAPRTRKPMATRAKPSAAVSPAATPKRLPRGPLADGFDHGDVAAVSPSRARERPRAATPALAAKRKRSAGDNSPVPLQLSAPRSQRRETDAELAHGEPMDAALLDYFRRDDGRFELLHRLMAHTAPNGKDRVLEALAQHAFPSDPARRLSSMVYDALAAKTFADAHALALDMALAVCQLWAQCLAEKHYAPVNVLLDALHFVLACSRCETACAIKARFVPLMVDSIDLVANPLSRAAKAGRDAVSALYASGHGDVTAHIDVLACLDMLHLIATSCVGLSDTAAAELWASIPSDFAIMLLNPEQPMAQISLTLHILATSALPSSIGPISPQPGSQAAGEDALIGRLTNLLTETPTLAADAAADAAATLALRLQVVELLSTLAVPAHGAARLGSNRICTGRLLKHLDRVIAGLYQAPLAPTQDAAVASINATVSLVHHIATTNPGFDVKSKLVHTLGGVHAYLVSLARVAFSEALVLEAGVDEGTVDMAHGILDGGLSMEEGEAFAGVFGVA